MKAINKTALLVIIVLFAFTIRVWGVSINPPSLNWDEASLGYNSFSILKSGRDEWGKFLPAIFPAFGDYKLPVYIYMLTPLIKLFGLNAFSVRLLSVIAGSLTVFASYLITNIFFSILDIKLRLKNKLVNPGHLSALILAIMPWHFFLSRPALEASLGLCLFSFGIYFLLKATKQTRALIPTSILLGLSMHTYNSYRVLVPIIAIIFLAIYFKNLKLKNTSFWLSFVISVFFSLILVVQIKNGDAFARYQKLKILNENTIYQIGQSRQTSQLPAFVSKLIYNKPVYFINSLTKNYFKYYSLNFWNQSFGAQTQFAIPNQNLTTYPALLLLVIGFIYLLFLRRNKLSLFFITAFLLSPLAASLTNDPPQAIRPSSMIIFIPTLSVLGIQFLLKKLQKYQEMVLCLTFVATTYSAVIFLFKYWYQYPVTYSQSWQYGYRQIYDFLDNNLKPNQNVFITKRYAEPHIFYFFYNNLDPQLVQSNQENIRFKKSEWLWTDKVGHYYFLNDWQIPTFPTNRFTLESGQEVLANSSILVTSPQNVPTNSTILKTIDFLDGSPAFIIVSIP